MPYTLLPHQTRAATETHHRDRLAYLWSPRLGKSYLALDFLVQRNVRRAVVTCPLVVCSMWQQILTEAGYHVHNGHKGPVRVVCESLTGDGVLLLNDDRLSALKAEILKWKPEALIVDESHRMKAVSSARGKAMRALAKKIPLIRLLTGTPTPNHMGNLWGQFTAVNSEIWETSFERFAKRFLIRDSLFPSRIIGTINTEKLREMLTGSSNILRRADVYGPDTWQTVCRDVELPPKARKLYNNLVKDWLAENTFGKEEVIAVPHMLKRMVRLQQLTSGYIPDDKGVNHAVHTAKTDAVLADLEDILNAGEKAVIFHRFTWEGEHYRQEIARRLNVPTVSISGGDGSGVRDNSIRSINEECSVIIVQTQAGGIGISLKSCTHALFVSQSFSFDDEEQARDRIYAPGDRKVVTYYRCKNTIDTYIASVLANKSNIHEVLTHADIQALAFGEHKTNKKGAF